MQRAIDRLEPFQRAISKAHLAAAGVSVECAGKETADCHCKQLE